MRELFGRGNHLAWLVLLASVGLSLLVAWGLWQQSEAAAEKQFALQAEGIVSDIDARLRQHEQILLGGAGLFDASDAVGRDEWRAYVERLQLHKTFPGIQGVGFSKAIQPADLKAHIAAIRAEGFPDYGVRPPGERPLYTSIIYLEPFVGRNLAAFGFDMFSEATRNKAMSHAAATGQTAISGKVKLVQETHGKPQAGFLMYVPVYRKNMPIDSPEARWKALQGFVYSPYRVNDLMRGILGDINAALDFRIHDGADVNAESEMYASADEHTPDPVFSPRFTSRKLINAYGHAWSISLYSRPAFERQFQTTFVWLILLLGGGISAALFALTSSLTNRREKALALAESMTAQIRESEQRTQAILDNVIDGIISIDSRGTVASFNRAAERIFGYSPNEVIGNNVRMLMPEPHRANHDSYLHNYQATGVARIIGIGREVEGQRKDGSLFPMDLSISEISHHGDINYVGLVRDITERKRIDQMKTEFVSTVSHELRTPLTSISGALGLLTGGAMGALPEQAKPLLDIAHKNSLRLSHLINDLLDMEKMAAGKMKFDMQVQPVMSLIEQAIESTASYADQHGIRIELIESGENGMVRVDSRRFVQILSNFLSNAAKFSPAGAAIEVSVHRANGNVRVAVTDHGPGIPDEFRDRIFQKFSQADSSDTRQKGGTGLGLAITKELAERMGGRVGFESTVGKGTTFFCELPLVTTQADIPASIEPSDDQAAPRILVVEDDPDVAQLLAIMLSRAGYRPDVALDGQQALNCLERQRYAAMTLDLMLPDINGLEIIRSTRENPATSGLPIIVVSARMEDGRLAINGDFASIDWLPKPIDETRLLATLDKTLPTHLKLKPHVLHVEDDIDLYRVICSMTEERYDMEHATTLEQARAMLALQRYDIVILDLTLPDGSGWDLLPQLRGIEPSPRIIVLSGTELGAADAARVETALLKSHTSPRALLDTLDARISGNPPSP